MKTKNVYIIAGPNGSGKTTFADKFLPDFAHCPNFVNADLIAKKLDSSNPSIVAIKAGRLMLQEIDALASKGLDFGFETTLSGKSYVRSIKRLKKKGYAVHLFFLWIPSVALAIERIKDRVAGGGHDIPAEDVRRRFTRGISNFLKLYEPLLDYWMLFDNSGTKHVLIAKRKGPIQEIANGELFERIKKTVR